jgi:hypothetical protein
MKYLLYICHVGACQDEAAFQRHKFLFTVYDQINPTVEDVLHDMNVMGYSPELYNWELIPEQKEG